MEPIWFAERTALHFLSQQHPNWTIPDLLWRGPLRELDEEWRTRPKHASAADLPVFHSRSHAHHPHPNQLSSASWRSAITRLLTRFLRLLQRVVHCQEQER
ncbi:MAG TPA: hypothetical protein VH593_18245 [Ktedonobacteraceae bacterium]